MVKHSFVPIIIPAGMKWGGIMRPSLATAPNTITEAGYVITQIRAVGDNCQVPAVGDLFYDELFLIDKHSHVTPEVLEVIEDPRCPLLRIAFARSVRRFRRFLVNDFIPRSSFRALLTVLLLTWRARSILLVGVPGFACNEHFKPLRNVSVRFRLLRGA